MAALLREQKEESQEADRRVIAEMVESTGPGQGSAADLLFSDNFQRQPGRRLVGRGSRGVIEGGVCRTESSDAREAALE